MPSSSRNPWLLATGGANLGIALLHVAIICAGAPGYAYFGAGGFAALALGGSSWPAIVTAPITLVFLAWAALAASGAGLLPRMPFLRAALLGITVLYLARGLIVIPDVIRLVRGAPYPARHALFSATALVVGLVHAVGTARLSSPRDQ